MASLLVLDNKSGVCGSFDKDIYCPPNQCTNGGECTTFDGGYHVLCRCAAGYGGPQCQQDVNECLYQPCRNNGICTNLVNNYTCVCPLAAANGMPQKSTYSAPSYITRTPFFKFQNEGKKKISSQKNDQIGSKMAAILLLRNQIIQFIGKLNFLFKKSSSFKCYVVKKKKSIL